MMNRILNAGNTGGRLLVAIWAAISVLIAYMAWEGHNSSWIGGYGAGIVEGHDIAVYKCRRSIADCKPAAE